MSDLLIAPNPADPRLTERVTGVNERGERVETSVTVERALTLYLNAQEIVTMMTIGDYPDYLAIGYLLNQNMLQPDDVVTGVDASRAEIDALIAGKLATGWSLDRLDRPMRQLLRAGTYELLARADVPVATVISEYVDVAHAFYDKRETSFVNGLLDAVGKEVR